MTTITRKLAKHQWQAYFDNLSKHLHRNKVSVLVEGLDLGAQPEVEKVELCGVTYDYADDAIEITSDALTHRIAGPHDVYVQEDSSGALLAFKVTDDDGHEQIVQFESSLDFQQAGDA
jgi:uncharacterized protein DUF5335